MGGIRIPDVWGAYRRVSGAEEVSFLAEQARKLPGGLRNRSGHLVTETRENGPLPSTKRSFGKLGSPGRPHGEPGVHRNKFTKRSASVSSAGDARKVL